MEEKLMYLCMEQLGKDKVSRGESELYRHSRDESSHPFREPDFVFFPENTDDVVKVLLLANEHGIAVTPFGAGSGLEGQSIPMKKGISLNFDRMNNVVEFAPEDLMITVEPGMTRLQLNDFVNRHGLYFPIDPGADASIGGMVATNASGTTAVRYGSMRDQVLDLEVVLANGDVIHTGSKAKKSSSGYHLNGIFTGSEGTLGVITKVTVKLHGIPEKVLAARCTFPTPGECAEAAHVVLASGIQLMRMELVDAESIKQVNEYGNYSFPEAHSLFFEFAGSPNIVEEEASVVEELMHELGCQNWERANSSKERSDLWKARHELAYAYKHIKGKVSSGSDVCVPISKLAEMVVFGRELVEECGLIGGVFGHVGDGNFHTLIMYDPTNQLEYEKTEEINGKLALKAIALGGTCTGEHGVGLGKMKYQVAEHGKAVEWMKSMKVLFDPKGILNPEKMFY
ncbi:D-lactate dehydrogenase (cytochrome) [Psychrobacillus insolitus]|uniref:D-lactate dehydrogenase (cytochrome) n=1 Tax=Psychrobacillus insolitus TaxID=1461 RepID=A0A2W7NCW4_9BACI|nr:FAD-linked oxidase C-terminal domain-containing protein [Psychrobacillus insolitus]PZX08289.1 D-lactate dehydrogenase (cytochrome) [Psychrobacillus insolitus]